MSLKSLVCISSDGPSLAHTHQPGHFVFFMLVKVTVTKRSLRAFFALDSRVTVLGQHITGVTSSRHTCPGQPMCGSCHHMKPGWSSPCFQEDELW
jgi:hypothetical protein